jgi:hypothetical protein
MSIVNDVHRSGMVDIRYASDYTMWTCNALYRPHDYNNSGKGRDAHMHVRKSRLHEYTMLMTSVQIPNLVREYHQPRVKDNLRARYPSVGERSTSNCDSQGIGCGFRRRC